MTATLTTAAPADEELMDVREVSRRLGIGCETLLRWRRLGKIPAVKMSPKVLRFNLRQVAEALGIQVNAVAP